MTTAPIVVGVLVLLVIIWLVASLIVTYNSLVAVRVQVDTAWANIDVLLKRRHDELSKLLDTVSNYMGYEQRELKEVTMLRTRAGSGDGADRLAAEGALSSSVAKLVAVAENYPTLRASEQFAILQHEIASLEQQIAQRREFFNDAVAINNARLAQFPDSLLAGPAGLRQRDLFRATTEDATDVRIAFPSPAPTAAT